MGAFDDLIPKAQPAAGPSAFADLIPAAPQGQPQLPAPAQVNVRHAGGRGGPGANTVMVETEKYDPALAGSEGVPASVRMHVGNAPAQDRLANLQRFYPEAQPYGKDNFIFVNPKTSKWELYNPEGLDVGDVPSVARDIVTGTAATVGGVAAAAADTAATVGSGGLASPSYLNVPVAAGASAMAAGQGYDLLAKALGQIDTRMLGQLLRDAGLDFALNAGAEAVGPALKTVPGRVSNIAKTVVDPKGLAPERMAAAKAAGVQNPTAGMLTDSKLTHGVESTLGNLPGSANVMQADAERAIAEMAGGVEDLASKYAKGPVTTEKESVGATVQQGAQEGAARMKQQYGQLYETAYNMVGRDLPIDVSGLQKLRGEFQAALSQAEGSLQPSYGTAIKEIDTILADAVKNGGAIPLEAARRINTKIGKELDRPILTSDVAGGLDTLRKQTYGALKDSIDMAVAAANPQAGRVLAQANKVTEAYKRVREPFLEQVAKAKTPEQALNIALSGAKDGGTRLMKLRKSYTPEQWDEIAGHVLYSLGRAKPSAQNAAGDVFSPATFLSNWNEQKLSTGAKDALFSGQRYKDLRPALDRLASVIEHAKVVERSANPSGTGRQLMYATLLGGAGHAVGGVGGVATSIAAPYVTAKLMTSPKFVNWMASALKDTSWQANPTGLTTQLTRLATMMAAEPDMQADVKDYIDSVQKAAGSVAP